MFSTGNDQTACSPVTGQDGETPTTSAAAGHGHPVAANLARRLLTLASTRAAAGGRPWEWEEVERIALRILADLEEPSDSQHGN
jgi:hypothetical protein